jgi:ribosomal-protein-alanine N-acetyltransferase
MRIVPMTTAFAAAMITWRYPAPYDLYDMSGEEAGFLASPASGFFALTEGDELIGFRCFGLDGQVPGGSYDSSALDTGGGLRPDLTGKGLGRAAISTGLEFGRREFAPRAFRVTVASFNERALRVAWSLRFRAVGSFLAAADGRSFEILVRPESADSSPSAQPASPSVQ